MISTVVRAFARLIFVVLFGIGWAIAELGGFLDWFSWQMARYTYHLNEVFSLGYELPDPDLTAMVMVELEEIDEDEDDPDEFH